MKLNSIIFPAPTCSYSLESEEFLIWIPTKKTLSTKISPSFLRPNHKKSSSFEIQTRLFSPKCFFAPKTKEISSIYKIKHKKSESNIYYPPENTSTPLTSSQKSFVMSKNNLKNYILSKKPNILNNNKSNSNSSDVSNSNFFSTSNKKKILSVHMNLKYQSNNSFFTDKSENKKKPNQKLQNYNNDEYNISKQNITKSKHLKQNFINANSFYQNKSEAQTQRNQELWNYADSINNSEIRKSKSINMRDLNEKNYKENYNTSNKIELKSQDFKQIFFNPSQLLGEEKQNSDFVERNFLGLVINNSKKNFSEGLLKLKSPLKKNRKIPCFLFQYPFGSSIILLHFHGNAEDIGDSLKYMKKLSNTLKVNSLLVEYPGYGLYKGNPTSDDISKDAEAVFDYLVSECSIQPKNIILIGRSMGTGPATNLAASRNVGGLIMISGYTSIKSVVKDYAGSFAKCLISERFENIQKIKSVNCPILLIHGLLDKLIPYKHSMELKSKVNPSVHCEIFLSLTMTHNDFNVETDFLEPIKDFFKRAKVLIKNGNEEILKLPQEIKDPPRNIFRKGKSFLSLLYTKFKIT